MFNQTLNNKNALNLESYFESDEPKVDLPDIRLIEDIVSRYEPEIRVGVSQEEPISTHIFVPKKMMTLKRLKQLVFFSSNRSYFKMGQIYPYVFEKEVWRALFMLAHKKAEENSLMIIRPQKALTVITAHENINQVWDVDNFMIQHIHNALVTAGFLRSDDYKSLRYLVQGAKADQRLGNSYVTVGIYDDANGDRYDFNFWEDQDINDNYNYQIWNKHKEVNFHI